MPQGNHQTPVGGAFIRILTQSKAGNPPTSTPQETHPRQTTTSHKNHRPAGTRDSPSASAAPVASRPHRECLVLSSAVVVGIVRYAAVRHCPLAHGAVAAPGRAEAASS